MRMLNKLADANKKLIEITASPLDAKMTVEQVQEIADYNMAYRSFYRKSGLTEKAWSKILGVPQCKHREYETFTTKVPAHTLNRAGRIDRLMRSVRRRMKDK
jgi:hypothetical protein